MEAELLFITASIIARQMRFVNTFFQKNSKNMIFPKKILRSKAFSAFIVHYDIVFLWKSTKNHYDKSPQIFTDIFLHKFSDKKSYKMDIYKTAPLVYNIIPE